MKGSFQVLSITLKYSLYYLSWLGIRVGQSCSTRLSLLWCKIWHHSSSITVVHHFPSSAVWDFSGNHGIWSVFLSDGQTHQSRKLILFHATPTCLISIHHY